MLFESDAAFRGNREAGVGFSSYKRFFDPEVAGELQGAGMACQVAIGEFEEFLEGIEVHKIVDHKGGHNPQAGTAFKGFIQVLQVIFHGWPDFRSYFQ